MTILAVIYLRNIGESLNDFFDSNKLEIFNFSLRIQKKPKGSVFQYIGEFKAGNKNLKIYAKSSN